MEAVSGMSGVFLEQACVIIDLPDERCTRAAVIVLLMACVHEHMGDTPVCQSHVQGAADGELLCPECHAAGEQTCRLQAVGEVTESGEIRVLQG
ncbi:hypothetical protein ACQPYK_25300 [Streptosporangium sp. CA-135522]|uniref:hypothetical protein n=1 Tax=Streptosporangium sp. CA-135522 TaxID=3240072 RepID=UPI003D8BEBD1